MDELNHPGARELLRAQPLARLAYTGLDGFPRVIPIGFMWDGERMAWIGIEPRRARYYDFVDRVPAFLVRLGQS